MNAKNFEFKLDEDKELKEENKKLNDNLEFIMLELEGDKSVFDIANKLDMEFDEVFYYIEKFLENDLIEKILPSTSSMVRGEELVQLLNVIVQFLLSHVHAIPGAPPVPVGTDGTSANNILSQLQNAQNTILNPNIRIN